jgi:predicted GNAT superfamily acetyltransferase
MYRTFAAPLGAWASGGQSRVDSSTVRPIFPLNGGGFGGGVTVPLSDVPGGENTPFGSPPFFLPVSPACASCSGFLATTAKVYEKVMENNLALFSKRMVVLPEYRGHGIGAQLKWSQRDIAIQQGIQRIIWTYDPLLATNAYLNIHKLGCVTTTYLENPYGTDDSIGLVVLGSSDRLQVEWLVDAPHVIELANGRTGNMGRYVDSNGIISNSPSETNYGELDVVEEGGRYQLLSIPHDFVALAKTQPDSAKMWRELTRAKFQSLFNLGYIVIDFIRGENETVHYVLARREQS